MNASTRFSPRTLTALALLTVTGLAGCTTMATQAEVGAGARATTAGATSAPMRLNDAQVAAVVVTANNIDIEYARLALQKSANPQIRQFAEHMIRDHSGVNNAAIQLAGRLGVTPQESGLSQQLTAGANAKLASLSSLSGAAFDRAYIDNEVAYHSAVIGAVDTVLLPSTQNAELKAAIVGARPAFVAHLQHAQQVQASLGR